MQQAHTVLQIGRPEGINHAQQLGGRQPELGLLAAGVGPLAGGKRGEPYPQPYLRRDAELFRLLDHKPDLGLLLDHDEHIVAKLLADQCQVDELAILVAIADNGAAFGRQRQHRHEFRLGAGLQADGDVLGGDDVLHHRFLLVDLDRIKRGIAGAVLQCLDVAVKGAGQLAYPRLQNVRKTHQQRQIQPALAQLPYQLVQVDTACLRAARHDLDMALFVDVEIPRAPMANAIDTAAVCHGPGRCVFFARTSNRSHCFLALLTCWARHCERHS